MKKTIIVFTLLITSIVLGCGTNYTVLIKTSPQTEGVKIYANDDYIGKTDKNGKKYVEKTIYTWTGELDISAKYKNYLGKQTFQFDHADRGGQKNVLMAEQNRNPKNVGYFEVNPGHHFILEFGYLPETRGNIIVHTNVSHVNIYLNNEKIGNTSSDKLFTYNLEEGNYLLNLRKKNYLNIQKNINIKGGKDKNFYFDLEKKPKLYGYLKLTTNEKNVNVYIDGKLKGQIPGGETPFNKKIRTGEHVIMVKKEFFSPNSIKLVVAENEIVPYHFELVKATGGNELSATKSNIYQTKGNLTILTERNDLIVYIDGVKKIPPVQLTEIPAGFYKIRVKSNTIDDSFQITIKDEETKVIDLDEKYK